jgi:hypothetical protein
MNSTRLIGAGLVLMAGCATGFAQHQANLEKQLNCQNNSHEGMRAHHCEMREQSVASIGRLALESDNGAVTIKGWLQSGVLVRARIDASGENDGAAALLASKVWVDTSGGQVRAQGPERRNDSQWSVSYEIFVPQSSDLELKSVNGALTVSDVAGRIHFDLVNGAVRLKQVAGEVIGGTVNGAIQVDLASSAPARQMDLTTRNGAVTVTMPSSYSARVQAETNMGGIQSDFPLPSIANERHDGPRRLDFNIGAGGPLIHVTTGNGSVRFKRAETQ